MSNRKQIVIEEFVAYSLLQKMDSFAANQVVSNTATAKSNMQTICMQ